MSAEIHPFPHRVSRNARQVRAEADVLRYVARAEESFRLMASASTEGQRSALCEVGEAWLELAQAALPERR